MERRPAAGMPTLKRRTKVAYTIYDNINLSLSSLTRLKELHRWCKKSNIIINMSGNMFDASPL